MELAPLALCGIADNCLSPSKRGVNFRFDHTPSRYSNNAKTRAYVRAQIRYLSVSLSLTFQFLVTSYGSDAYITWLLDNTRIHILPSMNPDGFEVSKEGNCDGSQGRLDISNETISTAVATASADFREPCARLSFGRAWMRACALAGVWP